jgi:hypothetical protein
VLASAQTGEEPPQRTAVELRPLVDAAIAGLQPTPGVTLEVECPTG